MSGIDLSHDPVVVGMALDVLSQMSAEVAREVLREDGVDTLAAYTYMLRGGDTEVAAPEDILPAVVAAVERLASE